VRRRTRVLAAVGVVALLGAGVVAGVQFGLPWSRGDGDELHRYSGEAGSMSYEVHLPTGYDADGPDLPVVVALHGCAMTGFGVNSMRASTGLNAVADEEGFIVVYPTQNLFADKLNCWRSADPRHQHRGTGEPALVAGVTREVLATHAADASRVHVTGASSGAGTAVIMAATYPDLFAGASSIAGGEYALNLADPDDPDSTPVTESAKMAWAQMGSRARQVPLLVLQGTGDEIVPQFVGDRLVQQWLAVDDLVDPGSVPAEPAEVTRLEPDGVRSSTRSVWRAADGTTLVEYHVVDGLGHAWSGPGISGWFTDTSGPDYSRLVYEFMTRS